jgi:hypothetical protein
VRRAAQLESVNVSLVHGARNARKGRKQMGIVALYFIER